MGHKVSPLLSFKGMGLNIQNSRVNPIFSCLGLDVRHRIIPFLYCRARDWNAVPNFSLRQ